MVQEKPGLCLISLGLWTLMGTTEVVLSFGGLVYLTSTSQWHAWNGV